MKSNKRLSTAYLLNESFEHLWNYRQEEWPRQFFYNWKDALKCQQLPSNEKFAATIERHWEGIASYCQPENIETRGFVEGFNNKIRVLQRRAYGLRDKEYLRPNILTRMLPAI